MTISSLCRSLSAFTKYKCRRVPRYFGVPRGPRPADPTRPAFGPFTVTIRAAPPLGREIRIRYGSVYHKRPDKAIFDACITSTMPTAHSINTSRSRSAFSLTVPRSSLRSPLHPSAHAIAPSRSSSASTLSTAHSLTTAFETQLLLIRTTILSPHGHPGAAWWLFPPPRLPSPNHAQIAKFRHYDR